MKAILELVKMDVADIVTASGVCGEFSELPPTCNDD